MYVFLYGFATVLNLLWLYFFPDEIENIHPYFAFPDEFYHNTREVCQAVWLFTITTHHLYIILNITQSMFVQNDVFLKPNS